MHIFSVSKKMGTWTSHFLHYIDDSLKSQTLNTLKYCWIMEKNSPTLKRY